MPVYFFAAINERSQDDVASILARLPTPEQEREWTAMRIAARRGA